MSSKDNAFERRMKQVREYSNREPDPEIVFPVEPDRQQPHTQKQRSQGSAKREHKVVIDTISYRAYFGNEQVRELHDLNDKLSRLADEGWAVSSVTTTPLTVDADSSKRAKDTAAIGAVVVTVVLERNIKL